jgi:ketosteroid isomerase-like protein
MPDASTSLEANKALVLDFLDAVFNGPEERLVSLMNPDCLFFVLGDTWASGFHNKEEWLTGWRLATATIHSDVTVSIGAMTAEDDRVAVEAESRGSSPSGKPSNIQYHFLFRIRDGRISAFKEYFDTQGAFAAFDVAPAPSDVDLGSNIETVTHVIARRPASSD